MPADLPPTVASHLHARAVDQQVEVAACAAKRDLVADSLLPPAQSGDVRHRPVHACQPRQVFHHANRLPQGQTEQNPDVEAELDVRIRGSLRPTRATNRRPMPFHFAIQPHQQRPTPAKHGVVFGPVRRPVTRRSGPAHGRPDRRQESLRELPPPGCATSVTAPCARGIFWAGSGALSGADICPASAAALRCRGPVWCSRVGSRSKPRARRHSVAPWVSRSRLTTVAPYRSLPSLAPTSSRPCRLTPPRPETGRHRPGPSGPRPSAPSCWPKPPAPASVACAPSASRATCPAERRHEHGA